MNLHEAQQEFVSFHQSVGNNVNAYLLWRLSGDAPNSLCKVLGLKEEELKIILRFLRVYKADNNDSFSKNNFAILMLMCTPDLDWVQYRLNLKPERLIKIGRGGEGLRPTVFYDSDGTESYEVYPVEDEHVLTLRTNSQKNPLMILLAVASRSTTKNNHDDVDRNNTRHHENDTTIKCRNKTRAPLVSPNDKEPPQTKKCDDDNNNTLYHKNDQDQNSHQQ